MFKTIHTGYAVALYIILFIMSYMMRGTIFGDSTASSNATLQSGLHGKVKKGSVNFDMSARVDNE